MEKKLSYFDRMMVAITFAEAGESVWEDEANQCKSEIEGRTVDAPANGVVAPLVS